MKLHPITEATYRRIDARHHCRQRDFAANDLRWQDETPAAYFARLHLENARQSQSER